MNVFFNARPDAPTLDAPSLELALLHTDAGDSPATALAGIASKERATASGGHHAGRKVQPASVTTAGRLLAGTVMVGVIGALAFAGGAAGVSGTPASSLATPNGVHAYGHAIDHGPDRSSHFDKPIVGIAATPSGLGYWLVAADGGVFAFGDAAFMGSAGGTRLAQPVIGVAARPQGDGYWLVARDGGVFSFGAARFHGSASGIATSPIVGLAPTPSGNGYWLVGADGGVFSFGDAQFVGSATNIRLSSPIVGIAGATDGYGYWLLGADGGVLAFGSATFRGSAVEAVSDDAVSISAEPAGNGYLVARATGAVVAFGGSEVSTRDLPMSSAAPTVGVAARPTGGYWTAQGAPAADHLDAFLVCTRHHESSPNGPNFDDGYGAIDPSGTYRGAYQFDRSTWSNTARHTGRIDLVGVDPATASVADQDYLAFELFRWQGAAPWLNRCSGMS